MQSVGGWNISPTLSGSGRRCRCWCLVTGAQPGNQSPATGGGSLARESRMNHGSASNNNITEFIIFSVANLLLIGIHWCFVQLYQQGVQRAIHNNSRFGIWRNRSVTIFLCAIIYHIATRVYYRKRFVEASGNKSKQLRWYSISDHGHHYVI